MDWLNIVSIVIGAAGAVCAIIFGYLAFARNKAADDTTEGRDRGEIRSDIGYIKAGIDDIKRKQERQDEQHLEVITRLTAVEESAKQAHRRMDTHEKIMHGKDA